MLLEVKGVSLGFESLVSNSKESQEKEKIFVLFRKYYTNVGIIPIPLEAFTAAECQKMLRLKQRTRRNNPEFKVKGK